MKSGESTVAAAGSTNSAGVNTWESRTKEGEKYQIFRWLNKTNSKKCMLDVVARRSLVILVRVSSVW